MENQCHSVDELLEYQGLVAEGEAGSYRVCPKLSKGNSIVFEENIGEGGDGGWSKAFSESGKGKRAFIKEFASGKDRHKRGDFNKAMARDTKQKRKSQGPVC